MMAFASHYEFCCFVVLRNCIPFNYSESSFWPVLLEFFDDFCQVSFGVGIGVKRECFSTEFEFCFLCGHGYFLPCLLPLVSRVTDFPILLTFETAGLCILGAV